MTAQQIADAGFDVVLVDGNDFWIKDTSRAWSMVKDVITRAQAGSHALQGKVGVVGYSLGGAAALTYAARMRLHRRGCRRLSADLFHQGSIRLRRQLQGSVQMFGTTDTYKDCESKWRVELADMLTLHEYNGVGHGFNLATAAREGPGQDALERTIAQLKQALVTK